MENSVKLTKDQLDQASEMYLTFERLTYQIGQLYLSKVSAESVLKSIEDSISSTLEKIKAIESSENKMYQALESQTGFSGTIDFETGEYKRITQ